ncbi:hypothetical protein CPB86DRAFT_670043, partial [Serendipita vermifera]
LTILNLPPAIRYDSNHLFPVFIPGPHEPSTDGLNHLLGPIVTQLNRLYSTGFTLRDDSISVSRFRKIRARLSIVIADVPAACKCGGFASHAHRQFCRHCRTERRLMVEQLDPESWETIDEETHREAITLWRDAWSVKQRKDLFDRWGFRWTELAHLQYLDLTKCFVIDPMHAVLLGVIRNHVQ